MFETDKSDFAVPVTGYLMVALIFVIEGFSFLFNGSFIDNDADFNTALIFGLVLAIVGAVSLWKAYIIDGMTFLVIGAFVFSFSFLFIWFGGHIQASADIMVGGVLIFVGLMALRVKDILVASIDFLSGISFILAGIFFTNMEPNAIMLAASIAAFLCAAVALYTCYDNWSLVQDIASDYEDYVLDGKCGCGEEGCTCGKEDCECCKKE